MKKTLCNKCNNYFANRAGNYNRHHMVCDGNYILPEQRGVCKYCNIKFDLNDKPKGWMANHSRWCDSNLDREKYKKSNKTNIKSMQTPEARKKAVEGIKKAWQDGKYNHCDHKTFLGRTHSDKSKKLMSESALKAKHRRILRSTRKYICKDGSEVLLDSSWEEQLAIRLDQLNINWIRPKDPIQWLDKEGKTHNYFPDFYLTDYNIYIDPKNDIVYNITITKIEALKIILPNLIILRSLEECKNFKI